MSLLYHLDLPRALSERPEAVLAEVGVLREHFGGSIVFLMRGNLQRLPMFKWVRGLGLLSDLRQAEAHIQAHVIFHSELFPFLYLAGLKKPVIYSIVSGLGDRELLPPRAVLCQINTIVVTNSRDAVWLETRGFRNVTIIPPGINTAGFTCNVPSTSGEFVLVAGSAPWTKEQFATKGTETLLSAAKVLPWLRIIFLWRGVLYDEIMRRIHRTGLADRIEVINDVVDVNRVFGRAHAGVLIGNKARHSKAFPHSLIEALAAGKPVITSTCIPMSDYVEAKGCGLSIDGVNLKQLVASLHQLRDNYDRYQTVAFQTGSRDFDGQAMVSEYTNLLKR